MNTCWLKHVGVTKEENKENQIDLSSGYPNHNQRLKFDPALDNRFGLRGALIRNQKQGFDTVWSLECPLAVLFGTF